ncbi:hypothetical protein ACFZAR_42670 [Streptomyces sp. NPDC008222]|uniref:hypothetical protein n=1 Tax=Streptomyces sp. NPDC008222 TaxID=3364820 RepID=UPI0036EAE907
MSIADDRAATSRWQAAGHHRHGRLGLIPDVLQAGAVDGTAVPVGHVLGEVDAEGGSGQMIVQIDAQHVVMHHDPFSAVLPIYPSLLHWRSSVGFAVTGVAALKRRF